MTMFVASIRAMDLRFSIRDREIAFKRSLQPQLVRVSGGVSFCWFLAACADLALALVLAENHQVGAARTIHTASSGLSAFLATAFAAAAGIHLRWGRFVAWNWECCVVALFAGILGSVCIASLHSPLSVDGSQYNSSFLFSLANILIFTALVVPLRSCISWVLPSLVVASGAVRLAVSNNVELAVLIADVSLLGVFSVLCYAVSRQQDRLLRTNWSLQESEALASAVRAIMDKSIANTIDAAAAPSLRDMIGGEGGYQPGDAAQTCSASVRTLSESSGWCSYASTLPHVPSGSYLRQTSPGRIARIFPEALMENGSEASFALSDATNSGASSLAYSIGQSRSYTSNSLSSALNGCCLEQPWHSHSASQLQARCIALTAACCASRISCAAALRAAEIAMGRERERIVARTAELIAAERRSLKRKLQEERLKHEIESAGWARPSLDGGQTLESFEGSWSLVSSEALLTVNSWLHSFTVQGTSVSDGIGRLTELRKSNGQVCLMGGTAFIHGGRLFRVGRSDVVLQYQLAKEHGDCFDHSFDSPSRMSCRRSAKANTEAQLNILLRELSMDST